MNRVQYNKFQLDTVSARHKMCDDCGSPNPTAYRYNESSGRLASLTGYIRGSTGYQFFRHIANAVWICRSCFMNTWNTPRYIQTIDNDRAQLCRECKAMKNELEFVGAWGQLCTACRASRHEKAVQRWKERKVHNRVREIYSEGEALQES